MLPAAAESSLIFSDVLAAFFECSPHLRSRYASARSDLIVSSVEIDSTSNAWRCAASFIEAATRLPMRRCVTSPTTMEQRKASAGMITSQPPMA